MKVFRYKLDFYYQTSLIYLITLVLYISVRGTFIDGRFEFIYRDPIVYIMAFFTLFSFSMLILNRIRNRRIEIGEDRLRFLNRFKMRELLLNDIEWMHITKERKVETAGKLQVIVIKRKEKKRLIRIRVGRYERPDELIAAMKEIADRVPKRESKHRRRT